MLHSRDCAQVSYMNEQHKDYENRCKRDIQEDMKSAIDLVFDFKRELAKFHPGASECILRMIRDGF
jgi:hypothetical protein